jgi:diguanylate cyclase (GGDEF)-like protein
VGEVLAKAAEASACSAARIGGDEFSLLLPGMDERIGLTVKERIETLLELNNQFYAGNPITLSIGLATCTSGAQLEQCVQQADRAMYEEKARYYNNSTYDRRLGP